MALNPEIALQIQAPNLGVLGQGFSQGQQIAAEQNRLQDERIQRHAQASLRNTLANVDVNDPDAPNKIRQWMAGAGHADVGEQYAQQLEQYNNQRYEALQKQSADFTTRKMALAANAAEKARMETDPAKAQAHLDQGQRDIEALEKYYPGLQKYSPKLFDNSDYPKAGDTNAIRALSIQNMPADQQRKARFGFGVEDVSKQLEAGKPVAPVPQAGPQNPNGPALQPIQQQPQPYLPQEKLQIYSQLRANAPDEESRKLVESKMDDVKSQWWKEVQPKLDALVVPPKKGWSQADKSIALDKAYSSVPPDLKDSPQYKQWAIEHAKEQVNPQINFAGLIQQQSATPGMGLALRQQVDAGNLEGKDAIQSILTNRFMLPNAKQRELIEFAKGSGDSPYTVPQLKVFAKNAADPQNNRTITSINAVEPNLRKIMQFSDANGRLNIPMLNKAIQAGQFQSGDQTITDMKQLQKIIAEEAGKVFGTNATSDFKIKLGGETVDLSLGQDNFGSTMRTLSDAIQNKKNSLTQSMGPYSPWEKIDKAHPENAGYTGKPQIHPDDAKNAPTYKSVNEIPEGVKMAWVNGKLMVKQ